MGSNTATAVDAKNPAPSNLLVESFPADEGDIVDVGDSTYQKKAKLLNSAIQETGMGRYQWYVIAVFSLVQQDG